MNTMDFTKIITSNNRENLNQELVGIAKNNNFNLYFGCNYYWDNVPKEEQIDAIAVDDELIKFLAFHKITMSPDINELTKAINSEDIPKDIPVIFENEKIKIEGDAFVAHLSKTLAIWFDFSKAKVAEL